MYYVSYEQVFTTPTNTFSLPHELILAIEILPNNHFPLFPNIVGPPEIKINLTIPPFDINEGNTFRMECVADLNPPNHGGSFSWMLNGQPLRNGERVNIKSKYDPLGEVHVSEMLLRDVSWKDEGRFYQIHDVFLMIDLYYECDFYDGHFSINQILYLLIKHTHIYIYIYIYIHIYIYTYIYIYIYIVYLNVIWF